MRLPIISQTKKIISTRLFVIFVSIIFVALGTVVISLLFANTKEHRLGIQIAQELSQTKETLEKIEKELENLKNQDQLKRNNALEEELGNIKKTYKQAVAVYENLLNLKELGAKTTREDALFTKALTQLVDRNYASGTASLALLDSTIETQKEKIIATFVIPVNVPSDNTPPPSGFKQQKVTTTDGEFLVDIISADLASTKVIVDTASNETCSNNCPTLPLGDYVSRSGAYAGVNGSYFCPAEYPSCAGKTNSFDTLLMNKNKVYFNSDNNVYSTVPAVIFGSSWIRFVGRSLDWGRDTSIDSMIANQPLLVSGGNNVFGGNDDPKQSNRGNRAFVANKGNTVFIGVMFNVSVAQGAKVMKAMGMDNALNLDSGGSTALWSGGYKVGPGRNIPNAILFVKK